MKRFMAVLSLSGLLMSRVSAAAEDAPSEGPVSLSLKQAMDRAERTVPELGIAEGQIREAEATRVGANIRFPVNPRVQMDLRPGINGEARGAVGWSAMADVTFEVANAAGARLDEASGRVQVARSEMRVSRLQARLWALRAFVLTKIGAIQIEQARQSLDIAKRLDVVARERLAAGAGSEIETTSAEVELAESQFESEEANARRAAAEAELRFLLALPSAQPLELVLNVDKLEAAPEASTLVAFAWNNRPDLRLITDRIALLSASDERLRREAKPKMGIFGGVDASPDSSRFGLVGLSVELPFAQRNQGPRAQVAAVRNTELLRLETERRRTENAIRTLRALFEARRAQLHLLTSQGLPAAEKRFTLVEAGWRAGRFDILKLTAAAQDLVRLRSRRVMAMEDLWRERQALERLVGGWP